MIFKRALLFASCLAAVTPAVSAAAPCITAARTCSEWVTLAGGPSRSLVYRTFPLDTGNAAITRALVIVHGASRDADNYFRTALAAAFLAGALDNTIIVSPRFASNGGGCADTLDTNEVNWPCSGDSWRSGGATAANSKLTSYDFADEDSAPARPPGRLSQSGSDRGGGTFRRRPVREPL